jgi:hypothetical protein
MRRSATGVPTGDFIEDKNAILPIDAAIQSNLRETATRVLEPLTPRVERILRMRFGIGMNKEHTLEEVGRQFSVTARAHPADRRQGAAKAGAPEPLKGTEERSARAQCPPLARGRKPSKSSRQDDEPGIS